MKPMLIIPPAPARWPALDELLRHKGSPWIEDIQQRLVRGVPGAQDVFAVMPAGAQVLANATINKCNECGVLGHCYTRTEQRRRGHARRVLEAALAWFDMTGGRRLYLTTTVDLAAGFYAKFGFEVLHRGSAVLPERVTMWRTATAPRGVAAQRGDAPVTVGDLTRSAWPTLVALLQTCPGPDPRVAVADSAVGAEVFGLELFEHQERGRCALLGAYRDRDLVAAGSLATDRAGDSTYAILFPHGELHTELRASLLALAASRGYRHVDFPMEALAEHVTPAASAGSAEAQAGTSAAAEEPPAVE